MPLVHEILKSNKEKYFPRILLQSKNITFMLKNIYFWKQQAVLSEVFSTFLNWTENVTKKPNQILPNIISNKIKTFVQTAFAFGAHTKGNVAKLPNVVLPNVTYNIALTTRIILSFSTLSRAFSTFTTHTEYFAVCYG